MRTKLFIYSILFFLLFNCKNTEKAIQLEQVKSEYPITLTGDTVEQRVFKIKYPLQFKVKNTSFQERKLLGTYYYYGNPKVAHSFTSKWYNPGALLYKIQKNGDLVRPDGRYVEVKIFNKLESKEYIFYTSNTLDTSKVYKDMFDPYLEKMKELKQDTLHIGTIKEFEEKYPGFIREFLQGDSVQFKFKNNEAGVRFTLPVKHEELYMEN